MVIATVVISYRIVPRSFPHVSVRRGDSIFFPQLHVSRGSDVTMLLKEEAPIRDAKGRKTARPKRDEEVIIAHDFDSVASWLSHEAAAAAA